MIITHVHLDHVAGIINKAGEHVFPNARYVIVDDELTYWTGDRWEADINASPLPDGFKQGAIYAAKTYLPPIQTGWRSCDQALMSHPASRLFPLLAIRPATRLSDSVQTMKSLFIWLTWLIARIQACNTRNGLSSSITMATRQSQRESGFSARLPRTELW